MTHHWTVTRLTQGLGEQARAWDAQNRRLFNANPMIHSRFVDGLLKHFGNGSEHQCILERGDEQAAMRLIRPRGLGVWTTFLPSQAQIGPALIPKPEPLQQLIHSLPGFVIRLDLLCNDPLFGDLSTDNTPTFDSMDHARTINISLVGSFESYWAARPKKLTQNIARYERRLTAAKVTRKLLCITDPTEVSSAVARYAALETRGWKGPLGTAVALNTTQGSFYDSLMCQFAASDNAAVYELWFDDRLVASRLSISSDDMIVMLKTTYDETFDKYATGRLLLRDVIDSLFKSHPGKVIEFYTDASADQLAWATGQRWIRHVRAYRNSLLARLWGVLNAGQRALSHPAHQPNPPDNHSVEVFQHPDQFPPDVQQLFANAEQENFQLGVPWLRNLVNTVFPEHGGVRIYVLRKQSKPVAALPVLAKKTALSQQVESLSNYYTAVYAPLVEEGLNVRDLVPLVRAVRDAHAPLGSLRFAPMNPESTSYRLLLGALQATGLVPFRFFCFGNWYLQADDNWITYLKNRSGTLRSTLKRMTKKFAADGGTLELVRGGADLDRGVAAYERVYALSWKQAEPYPNFIPGLVRTCAERGWLRLGVAWLKGEPIAAQIWIVANGNANIYKVAYDEAYKAYAPGTLLTAMLMEQAIEKDRVAEVDYLIGDDPYKMTWMSHRRERWGIIAYNPKTLNGILGLSKEVLGRTLKPVVARVRTLMTQTRKPEH